MLAEDEIYYHPNLSVSRDMHVCLTFPCSSSTHSRSIQSGMMRVRIRNLDAGMKKILSDPDSADLIERMG